MTKFLYLFLFMISFFQLVAQDLREMRLVGSPEKSATEIVSRRDNNGNFTAAIMVISDMDGFSYDAYNGVVGNVDSRPGMDMVYVQATERVLEIYKTGYRPLKIILSEEGIRLKPQEVWQITVAGDPPPTSTIPVTIRFTPTDAALFIDGQSVGRAATYALTPGDHALKIEKEGFQPVNRTITVSESQVFFEYTLERQPDAGLQIETTPAGATVYLDGVSLGPSPVAVFYKPGTYPVRIVKEGYVTLEGQTLDVTLPNTRKSYTLEENVGYLTVNTHTGASVYLNDQLVSSPKNVKLPPQLVRVKVTMPKAETLEQQVVLKRNDRLSLDLYPVVQTASLQVAVTPFDAAIELSGDAGEKFTATGMKVFEKIPVGTYTIKVTAPGHDALQETVTLKAGDRQTKTLRLTPTSTSTSISSSPSPSSFSSSDYGIEMVRVKGGTFTMGCTSEQGGECDDDEKPAHQVTVSDFYIGKYEVTQKQWQEIMGNNPSSFKNCDNCPVENVSWNDIQEFIKKLNQLTGKKYRLPTEAEWEFAARGGASTGSATDTKYAGSNTIDEVAWYSSNSDETHPVGRKKPNELGVYDMSGNVWEWCEDDWHDNYNGAPTNGRAWIDSPRGDRRVLRGGSWISGTRNCRVSGRDGVNPGGGDINVGFRLAQDF